MGQILCLFEIILGNISELFTKQAPRFIDFLYCDCLCTIEKPIGTDWTLLRRILLDYVELDIRSFENTTGTESYWAIMKEANWTSG